MVGGLYPGDLYPVPEHKWDEMGKVPVSLSIDNLICCLDTVVSFKAFWGRCRGSSAPLYNSDKFEQ